MARPFLMPNALVIFVLVVALMLTAVGGAFAQPQPRDIEAGCPESRVTSAGFTDTAESVFATEIDCVVWWKIASGRSASSYGPELSTNRAQMATFFANLILESGGELPENPSSPFSDTERSVHSHSINALAAAGVVAGTSDTTYSPSRSVTRAQMATFISRTYEYLTGEELVGDRDYFDDDTGSVHENAINAIAQVGITGGDAGGNFRPQGTVTRGAMAAFLARTLDLLVDTGFAEPPPMPPALLTSGDIVSRSGTRLGGECQRGDLRHAVERISGNVYENSLSCIIWDGRSGWAEFDLGRDYDRFRTTVGLADRSPVTDRTVRFSVIGDGATLYTTTVDFGEAVDIDVNVTDVLRLRLDVGVIRNAGSSTGTYVVWGDPTIGG
jgi:hypothetical protein